MCDNILAGLATANRLSLHSRIPERNIDKVHHHNHDIPSNPGTCLRKPSDTNFSLAVKGYTCVSLSFDLGCTPASRWCQRHQPATTAFIDHRQYRDRSFQLTCRCLALKPGSVH